MGREYLAPKYLGETALLPNDLFAVGHSQLGHDFATWGALDCLPNSLHPHLGKCITQVWFKFLSNPEDWSPELPHDPGKIVDGIREPTARLRRPTSHKIVEHVDDYQGWHLHEIRLSKAIIRMSAIESYAETDKRFLPCNIVTGGNPLC